MALRNESKAVLAHLARHFIWLAVRMRAGPDIPEALLADVAKETAGEIPPFPDPVQRVEWHISRIAEIARQRAVDAAAVITAVAAAGLPVMDYPRGALAVSHYVALVDDDRAETRQGECSTTLPAAICRCGRYLLVAT